MFIHKLTFSWFIWRESFSSLKDLLACIVVWKGLDNFFMATCSPVAVFVAEL